MSSRNQIQTEPAAEHTHDCLLGRRERVTVRAGLAIPQRLSQEQSFRMFGSDWFLDLPYRVVTIRQVLNTGDAIARASVSVLQGARARLRWRALL